jgi:hypothetical protein
LGGGLRPAPPPAAGSRCLGRQLGSKVGALIGLGIEGEEGLEKGAEAGAEAAADGVDVFTDEQAGTSWPTSRTTQPPR